MSAWLNSWNITIEAATTNLKRREAETATPVVSAENPITPDVLELHPDAEEPLTKKIKQNKGAAKKPKRRGRK
jgi:hypothetical protein